MPDLCFTLVVLLLVLAVITVVGHGLWALMAFLFRAGKPRRAGRERPCVFCGHVTSWAEGRCGWCGRELHTPLADELADLAAVERQLPRLARSGELKPDVAEDLLARVRRCRSRLLESPVVADLVEERPPQVVAPVVEPPTAARPPAAQPRAPVAASQPLAAAPAAPPAAAPPAVVAPKPATTPPAPAAPATHVFDPSMVVRS
jgi:hypothetical protein